MNAGEVIGGPADRATVLCAVVVSCHTALSSKGRGWSVWGGGRASSFRSQVAVSQNRDERIALLLLDLGLDGGKSGHLDVEGVVACSTC